MHLVFTAVLCAVYFAFRSADGRVVELMPHGAHVRVTSANRWQFVAAVDAHKRNEFAQVCEAMRQGLIFPFGHIKILLA